NIRGCADGWPVTRAGPSTSPRPRRPGLTPLKASSPSSHASVSSAASSNPSSTCNSPSTASWPRPTPIPTSVGVNPLALFEPLSLRPKGHEGCHYRALYNRPRATLAVGSEPLKAERQGLQPAHLRP